MGKQRLCQQNVRDEKENLNSHGTQITNQQNLQHYQVYNNNQEELQHLDHESNSNWVKVKQAFLTPASCDESSTSLERTTSVDTVNISTNLITKKKDKSEVDAKDDRITEVNRGTTSFGGSLPPSPNARTAFTFEGLC